MFIKKGLSSILLFLIAFTSASATYTDHSISIYTAEAESIESRVLEDHAFDRDFSPVLTKFIYIDSSRSLSLNSVIIENSIQSKLCLKQFLISNSHSGLSPPALV